MCTPVVSQPSFTATNDNKVLEDVCFFKITHMQDLGYAFSFLSLVTAQFSSARLDSTQFLGFSTSWLYLVPGTFFKYLLGWGSKRSVDTEKCDCMPPIG